MVANMATRPCLLEASDPKTRIPKEHSKGTRRQGSLRMEESYQSVASRSFGHRKALLAPIREQKLLEKGCHVLCPIDRS